MKVMRLRESHSDVVNLLDKLSFVLCSLYLELCTLLFDLQY